MKKRVYILLGTLIVLLVAVRCGTAASVRQNHQNSKSSIDYSGKQLRGPLTTKGNIIEDSADTVAISDYLQYDEPLEEAVKRVKSGGVILVDADVYHRNNQYIEITKTLTIKGKGRATIYIDNKQNAQTGPFIYAHSDNDVTLTIQDVVIDGKRYGKREGSDRNRLFEIVRCDFILRNCTIQNMHYACSFGIGGQSEFISVLQYRNCEISDCTFRRINSQIEGIYLKPVYDLYEGAANRPKENINANNHRDAKDFAYIHNNKFLADTRFNPEKSEVTFANPDEYVSSWFGIFCGRCEFSGNYISGSAGSSVHLHVYDSKIEGNTFMPTLNSGVSINMNEFGFPYGFIPYNDTIRNNTFRNVNDCIQCDYGHDILVEGNTFERIYELSANDKRSNRFLVMRVLSPYYTERQIKNFTVRNNHLKDIRNFIEWNQQQLTVENLRIEGNKVKLADEYNRGMIDFDFVPSITNVTIKNNEFDFGTFVYLGKVYSVKQMAEPSLISYGLKGKQRIKKLVVENNVFKAGTKKGQFAVINYRDFSGGKDMTVELPAAKGLVVKNNKGINGERLNLK